MTLFTEDELLVLADMTGIPELLGVPQLQAYRFNQSITIPKGIKKLEEKQLLVRGRLSKKGFYVANLIEHYGKSNSYFCFDGRYYVATEDQAILLKKEAGGYQLTIQEPEAILGQLLMEYAILRRKGTEKEKKFYTKHAVISENELAEQRIEAFFMMGSIKKMENNVMKEEYGIALLKEELYRVRKNELKRVSRFWVNQWLVDHLKIKYEQPKKEYEKQVNWFDKKNYG